MSKICAIILALFTTSAASALDGESTLVASEACGPSPTASCLTELRKVCHAQPSFRCYYSFKARLDAIRQVGFSATHDRDIDE